MINPKTFYKNIYSIMNTTPLITNCGRLCGCLCCSDTDAGDGMYLYPFEEVMFGEDTPFADISDSNFKVSGKYVRFITCDGTCIRERRPLACRIFPLLPYVDVEGNLQVIYDPRAVDFCPLEHKKLTRKFKKQVDMISKMLFKVSETKDFLIAQSRLVDDFIDVKLRKGRQI